MGSDRGRLRRYPRYRHPHAPRRDGSEIARINSTRPGIDIELQPDTWRLLQLARRLYDLTDGIFDPCLPTRPVRLGDIEIQPNDPVLICHYAAVIAPNRALSRDQTTTR